MIEFSSITVLLACLYVQVATHFFTEIIGEMKNEHD